MTSKRFDLLTLFPEALTSYLDAALLARARKVKAIDVRLHNFRDFATDRHHTVDDTPYGGGPGMVLKVEPIDRCLRSIRRRRRSRVILLDPKGELFTQQDAQRYASKYDQLILVSGRYEGFDERIIPLTDEQRSVGPYVLSGGELPALTIVEAVTRLLPGVVDHGEGVHDDTYSPDPDYVQYPQYTRPETYRDHRVPPILLSGDHGKIAAWRRAKSGTR